MNEPIRLTEERISRQTEVARGLLRNLETAMVRCGYVRDGSYNNRDSNFSGRHDPYVSIYWHAGKIVLPRRKQVGTHDNGRPKWESDTPKDVSQMSVDDLVRVAHHLAPFVDALEGHSRHLAAALERACETVQALIDTIQADPKPQSEAIQG